MREGEPNRSLNSSPSRSLILSKQIYRYFGLFTVSTPS